MKNRIPIRASLEPTCACCNRALTAEPVMVGGLPFGPVCKDKASRLAALLETAGLELPIEVEMASGRAPGFYTGSEREHNLRMAARRVGLELEAQFIPGEPPRVRLTLKRQPTRAFLKTFDERRREFRQSLHGGF